MDIDKAKELMNETPKKAHSGIGWEIGAYIIRVVSVAAPPVVVMALENSWFKNSLGMLATLLIIALFIIFRKPLKQLMTYIPGVVPFAIFVVIALFFDAVTKSLLLIGISGLIGSVIAAPLHMKYLSYESSEKSIETTLLEKLMANLK